MNKTPMELIVQEFDCYYQADEIVWRDDVLGELAKCSADRFLFYGGDIIDGIADALKRIATDPQATCVMRLEEETNIEWSNSENWPRFQKQIQMILKHLEGECS